MSRFFTKADLNLEHPFRFKKSLFICSRVKYNAIIVQSLYKSYSKIYNFVLYIVIVIISVEWSV